MTVYGVTGASGQLGRLVVQGLLDRGESAGDVVAIARHTDSVAALGVQVRRGDSSGGELAVVASGFEQLNPAKILSAITLDQK